MSAEPAQALRAARALLFVPGDRPERFAKAAASGADVVIMDLEDAVAPDHKDRARVEVASALAAGVVLGVRINASGTPWFDEDCAMVAAFPCVVVLPKAEDADVVARLVALLRPGSSMLALVETAVGVLDARALAGRPGVDRLALGTFDLASELGVSPDDTVAMAAARGQLVLASAAAGLPGPVDGVTAAVGDDRLLAADLDLARRIGFTGKLCIHPNQVPATRRRLGPTAEDVAWAIRVSEAAGETPDGVTVVDGRMVDRPVVRRAQQILAAAGEPVADR